MPPIILELTVDDRGTPIIKSFAGSVQQLGTQVQQGGGHFQRTTQHTERFTNSMGSAAKHIALASAAFLGFQGITGLVNTVTGSITEFDKQLRNVDTVLIGSGVSIKQLEQEILRLPPSLGSAAELARGLYQALSAGVEPAKAVAFVGEQAKLASAGLTDLSTTVKVSTAAMDAFGIRADQIAHVSDVLFTVVQRGKVEFGPLASSIATVFPLAKNLGLSFEEVAATVTTLTKVFPTVSEGVTGFRSLLSGVISNLDNFKAAGIDAMAVLGTQGVAGLMTALAQATGGSADVLKARFIPEIEGSTAALALMGPQMQAQKDNVQAFTTTVGASTEAFRKQQEGISAAMDRIKTAIERVVLGGGLTPLLTSMLQPMEAWLTTLAQGGEASVQFAQVATSALSNIVSGLGLLTVGSSTVISGWLRIGQGVTLVTDIILDAQQQINKFLGSIGLASAQSAADLNIAIDKMRVKALLLSASFGESAESWDKTSGTLQAGFDAIQANLGKAGAQAAAFAASIGTAGSNAAAAGTKAAEAGTLMLNTILLGQNKTVEAIKISAQTADAANAAMLQSKAATDTKMTKSTEAVVSGTITFWENGEQKVKQVFEKTHTAGTGSAAGIGTAFTKAGLSTIDTLQGLAKEALARFQIILASGKATPEQLLEEWDKTTKAIAAGAFKQLPDGYAATAARMQEIARKSGGEIQKAYTDAFGDVKFGTKDLFDPLIAGTMNAQAALQDIFVPAQAFSAVFKAVTEATVRYGANAREHLTDATIAAAEAYGLLGKRAEEAGDKVEGAGEKAKDTEKQVSSLANVELAPIFTPWADDLQGIRAQMHDFTMQLINTSHAFATSSIGIVDFGAFVQHGTEQAIKALEILRIKEFELENQTWNLTRASEQLGSTLAMAYATIGAASSKELQAAADRAVQAFTTIQQSGDESAERLREIWINDVLPQLLEAYGETSAQALAAMSKYGDAVTGQAEKTFGTITQMAQQTVDKVSGMQSALFGGGQASPQAAAQAQQIRETHGDLQDARMALTAAVDAYTAAEEALRRDPENDALSAAFKDAVAQVRQAQEEVSRLQQALTDLRTAAKESADALGQHATGTIDTLGRVTEEAMTQISTVVQEASAGLVGLEAQAKKTFFATLALGRLRPGQYPFVDDQFFQTGIPPSFGTPPPSLLTMLRQHGGPVLPGRTYIVGEAGPESFVPTVPGVVVPTSRPQAAPVEQRPAPQRVINITIPVTFQSLVPSRQAAQDLVRHLEGALNESIRRGWIELNPPR